MFVFKKKKIKPIKNNRKAFVNDNLYYIIKRYIKTWWQNKFRKIKYTNCICRRCGKNIIGEGKIEIDYENGNILRFQCTNCLPKINKDRSWIHKEMAEYFENNRLKRQNI